MYARVATFKGGDLSDAAAAKTLAIAFFESEEDYRQGDETLNSMSPPSGDNSMGERAGVEKFEVVLELEV